MSPKGQFFKNTVYLERSIPYFAFVSTNAVLVRKFDGPSRRTNQAFPSGGWGTGFALDEVLKKRIRLLSRQPSAATFSHRRRLITVDSTSKRCNTRYLAGQGV